MYQSTNIQYIHCTWNMTFASSQQNADRNGLQSRVCNISDATHKSGSSFYSPAEPTQYIPSPANIKTSLQVQNPVPKEMLKLVWSGLVGGHRWPILRWYNGHQMTVGWEVAQIICLQKTFGLIGIINWKMKIWCGVTCYLLLATCYLLFEIVEWFHIWCQLFSCFGKNIIIRL